MRRFTKEKVSQKFAFRGVAARNKRKQVGLAVFPPCELSSFEKRKLHDEYHIKVYEGTIYIVDIVAISKYMRVQ